MYSFVSVRYGRDQPIQTPKSANCLFMMFLNFVLYRKPVRVVAGLVPHVETHHAPESYVYVLEYLVPCGSHMYVARGVRRPVHEVEFLALFANFTIYVMAFPEPLYFFFLIFFHIITI